MFTVQSSVPIACQYTRVCCLCDAQGGKRTTFTCVWSTVFCSNSDDTEKSYL